MTRTPVIDAHMHVGSFPMFGAEATTADLESWMDAYGIDIGIVFAGDNRMVESAIGDNARFRGLVWVNPRQQGHLDQLRSLLESGRFVGAKLHPLLDGYHPNDPVVHPVAKMLADFDLPALVHCGHPIFTLPWSIEELAVSNPDTKIILGHMGHGNIVYINASIDVAGRRPNVYLETSGMPTLSRIPHAIQQVGADRVLFGSDAPLHDPGQEKDKIALSGVTGADLEAILGGNAERIFKIGGPK